MHEHFSQDKKSKTTTQINRHFVSEKNRTNTELKKKYIVLRLINRGKNHSAIGTTD